MIIDISQLAKQLTSPRPSGSPTIAQLRLAVEAAWADMVNANNAEVYPELRDDYEAAERALERALNDIRG